MPKRISTTLLFTVVVAIFALFIHSEASGKVCIMYLGGDCVFWSGSVEGVLTANELGDIINEPKSLGFTIHPKGPGVLYCKNPEDINGPPKIITENVSFFDDIENSVTIKRSHLINCCGTAIVSVVAKSNDTQLRGLDKYCGDSNLKAIDFVPSEFFVEVRLMDKKSKEKLDTAEFQCWLPDWEKLGWDKNKPEQRPYKCEPRPLK